MKKLATLSLIILSSFSALHAADRLASGSGWTMAICNDGTVKSWGLNNKGQLGIGSTANSSYPQTVTGLNNIIAISAGFQHSMALRGDGTVWVWGENSNGQIGRGDTLDSNVPVCVPGLVNVVAVSAGHNHCLALKNDGTVWAWGWNTFGQLGVGIMGDQWSPLQVTGASSITAISAGERHSLFLHSDSTLYGSGTNVWGQLASWIGSTHSAMSIGLVDQIVAISAGGNHSVILTSDGRVWTSGYNSSGQLGKGDFNNSNGFVLSTTSLLFTAIETSAGATYALCTDSTVWAWGANYTYQLGDGTGIDQNLPAPVLNVSSVVELEANWLNAFFITASGVVWGTGSGLYGQLANPQSCTGVPLIAQGLCLLWTSVAEQQPLTAMRVYPNPSLDGQFSVRFTLQSTEDVAISLCSLEGRIIYSKQISAVAGEQVILPILLGSEATAGAYILEIRTGGACVHERLIIN